jgi:hypothetical protein
MLLSGCGGFYIKAGSNASKHFVGLIASGNFLICQKRFERISLYWYNCASDGFERANDGNED